jgi:hypothetical protein
MLMPREQQDVSGLEEPLGGGVRAKAEPVPQGATCCFSYRVGSPTLVADVADRAAMAADDPAGAWLWLAWVVKFYRA